MLNDNWSAIAAAVMGRYLLSYPSGIYCPVTQWYMDYYSTHILRQQFSLHQDLKPGKHQDHTSTTGIGCMLVVRKYPCTLCANNVMLLEQSLVAWTSTHQIQPIYLLYPKSFLHFKTGADKEVCIFPSDKPRCPKCNNLVWISSAMLP